MKKLMIVLLGSLLCYGATAQNTVITNTVYVTNTVIVQQPAPTVSYQPAPVYVGPPVVVAPFGFPHYYHHYYGPSIHIGVGFGGHRRWR